MEEAASRPFQERHDENNESEILRFRGTMDEEPDALFDNLSAAFSVDGNGAQTDGMRWGPVSACNAYDHVVDPRQQVVRESTRTLNMRAHLRSSEEVDNVIDEQPIDIFFVFLPLDWIKNKMLPAMTERARVDNKGADPFTWEHLQ